MVKSFINTVWEDLFFPYLLPLAIVGGGYAVAMGWVTAPIAIASVAIIAIATGVVTVGAVTTTIVTTATAAVGWVATTIVVATWGGILGVAAIFSDSCLTKLEALSPLMETLYSGSAFICLPLLLIIFFCVGPHQHRRR